MEPGAPVVFERGKEYTRGEVAAALGGGASRAAGAVVLVLDAGDGTGGESPALGS